MVERRTVPPEVITYARAERLAMTLQNHAILRNVVRDLLLQTGDPTNPAFSDSELIASIRERFGLKPAEPWDEMGEDYHLNFKKQLARTFEEAGVVVKEPITEIPNLVFSARIALNSQVQ